MHDAPPLAKRGNPVKRRRGHAVRALLVTMVKPQRPEPLDEVCALVALSRSGVCRHLALLVEAKRIGGYSTASGLVRVW